MYLEHGMEGQREGAFPSPLRRGGGGEQRFDAQLIPFAKNLTLMFFIITVFRISMKDMELTGRSRIK